MVVGVTPSVRWAAVLLALLTLLLSGCGRSDEPKKVTNKTVILDLGKWLTPAQERGMRKLKSAHDGDLFVITIRRSSPTAEAADALVREAIKSCPDPGRCENSGVFVLVSRVGAPQLRVGTGFSRTAFAHGLTYGTEYLEQQALGAKMTPEQQIVTLGPRWSSDVNRAAAKGDGWLGRLVGDEMETLVSPDYGVGSGWALRIDRWVTERLVAVGLPFGGPLLLGLGFPLATFLIRRFLWRRTSAVAGILRWAFGITMLVLAIPVSHALITMLGYRMEDRLTPPSIPTPAAVAGLELWAPTQSWTLAVLAGTIYGIARLLALIPTAILVLESDRLEDANLTGSQQVDALVYQGLFAADPAIVARWALQAAATAVALGWAAHGYLPRVLVALLVVPAALGIPASAKSARNALRWWDRVRERSA